MVLAPGVSGSGRARAGETVAALVLGIMSCAPAAFGGEIVIGILSPTGGVRSVGKAHQETIRFALDRAGPSLPGDLAVPYTAEFKTYDRDDPASAVGAARELVDAGAVAILGPVDTASVDAVLRAGLEVPMLAALATTPSLTRQPNPWFFRMTLDDDERMRLYAEALRRHEDLIPAPRVVLYDASPYGLGLWTGLHEALNPTETTAVAWPAALATPPDHANPEALAEGRGFVESIDDTVLTPAPRTIFVLGPNTTAVPIARGIQERLRQRGVTSPLRFHFVGSDSELRTRAPEGSYTIGEPTILADNGTDVAKMRAEFAEKTNLDAEDFIVTAYEAASFVLLPALGQVVTSVNAPRSSNGAAVAAPPDLRRRLRERLEAAEFDSMERWRHIRLHNGQMSGAPVVPVFAITPHLDLVDFRPQAWIEVEAPKEIGFLEGPVVIRMQAHGFDVKELQPRVVRIDGGAPVTIPTDPQVLPDGSMKISFYPHRPTARYRLENPNRPMNRADVVTVVRPGDAYPIAVGGALLGSLLFVLAVTEQVTHVKWSRVVLGAVTGVVLAAFALHRDYVPGIVPLPSLGGSLQVNAFWSGFAGGWFGPGALARFIPGAKVPERAPSEDEARPPAPLPEAPPPAQVPAQ